MLKRGEQRIFYYLHVGALLVLSHHVILEELNLLAWIQHLQTNILHKLVAKIKNQNNLQQ